MGTLGGYYVESADATRKEAQTKKAFEETLSSSFDWNVGASGSFLTTGGKGEGGVDTERKVTDAKGSHMHGSFTLGTTTVTYHRTVKGGDALAAKVLWKQSLVYNANYGVIDRPAGDLLGVWTLLPADLDTDLDTQSLAQEFEAVWMNEALRPGKPYIEDVRDLTAQIREEFIALFKSGLVKRASEGIGSTQREKDFVKDTVERLLKAQLMETDWYVDLAVQRCRNAAQDALDADKDQREQDQKVVFLKVHVNISGLFVWEKRCFSLLAGARDNFEPKLLNCKWPAGAEIEDDPNTNPWGCVSYSHVDDTIFYSNNKLANPGGPEAMSWGFVCTATQRNLINANWDEDDINDAIKNYKPMYKGDITLVNDTKVNKTARKKPHNEKTKRTHQTPCCIPPWLSCSWPARPALSCERQSAVSTTPT